MRLLLADSGSTKTEWRFLREDGSMLSALTEGYNPYQVSTVQIEENLRRELVPQLGADLPDAIHFYGSGCGTPEKKQVVADALNAVFPAAELQIESDLLGAARSLCGHEKGIAAILGTGSNSCSYDGRQIIENRPSLGYVLGDEGSGASMGKELLRLFLYGEMEAPLKNNFEKRFQPDKAAILDRLYGQTMPNRFLASFGKFIYQNMEQPQCTMIAVESFRAFFRHHILQYPQAKEWPLHVTGSIGFYFSNLLRRVAEEQQVRLGRVTEMPMAGLVNYYRMES